MSVNELGIIIAIAALALTVWQMYSNSGRLKINIILVDSNARWGSIVNSKDHLLVTAINTGKLPLVVKSVKLDISARIINIFSRKKYRARSMFDKLGVDSTGGSFEKEQQVDHGHSFKMIVRVSAGILVGKGTISAVSIPDSLGRVHKANYFQILKIKYQLYRQYPEWRRVLEYS